MEKLNLKKEHFDKADVLEELVEGSVFGARRTFMKKGGVAAAAMAMAGTWLASVEKATAQTGKTDLQMITAAYTLEQQAVNTYSAAAGLKDPSDPSKSLISGDVLSVALAFQADHQVHAVEFRTLIQALGGTVPADATNTTLDDYAPGANSQLTSTAGILRYALGVEIFAATLWFQNFKSASDLRVRRAFADLAPNEAAHAAILRAALKFILGVPTDHDNAGNIGRSVVPYSQLSPDGPVF